MKTASYLVISRGELEKILSQMPSNSQTCVVIDLETRKVQGKRQSNVVRVTSTTKGNISLF